MISLSPDRVLAVIGGVLGRVELEGEGSDLQFGFLVPRYGEVCFLGVSSNRVDLAEVAAHDFGAIDPVGDDSCEVGADDGHGEFTSWDSLSHC